MIQIYADGAPVYDSRLPDYELLDLKVTTGLNKGGTAEFTMPPHHPAYGAFTSYKTILLIYRDNIELFRGRVLYSEDDFYNRRKIVCEGELCFFQDAVSRPYIYQASPAEIFSTVIDIYNDQVEPAKRFKVGDVTVTDPNDYIRLESESAESVQATINKLLERCGGYFVFTTNSDEERVISWYAALEYHSNQVIEFGENLLDFSRSGANTSLVTAVIPYGAKNEETGERVNILSVNDGVDYIQDDEAVALRGRITEAVYWDDVTEPANLLRKAQEYLQMNKYIVTALQLSALDLNLLDKDIDTFQVGDTISVRSAIHSVDESFLLTEKTEDLLNPANSTISLGKERKTLTSADVAGDNNSMSALHRVQHEIKADYKVNTANVVSQTEQTLTSLIQQTSDSIMQMVSDTYTTNDELTAAISTSMTQLADSFLFEFSNLRAVVDENDAEARTKLEEIYHYISFEDGDIILGASDSAITLTIENDKIVFKKNGAPFGWWDGVDFHTGNIVVEVNERAQFGNFAFIPRSNGSLSFLKVK